MKRIQNCLLSLVFAFFSVSASAAVLPGTYQLFDHPDGNLTNSIGPYGLRMDSLQLGVSGPVFSVNESNAEVFLTWDGGTSATITGDLYRHDTGDLWAVSHTIENIVVVANGFFTNDETTTVMTLTDTNNGGTVYQFNSKSDGTTSFAFFEDSWRCNGAPNCGPIVARGWFDGDPNSTDDWQVTAVRVIPLPAAAWMFASALLGLLAAKTRR